MTGSGSQKGAALITILLVVVIATVLGVSMTTEQNFAINRARAFFDQGIVRQYAYGGEELARQILHEVFVDSPTVDHMGQNWAQPLIFEFEQGEIELLIEDLQSKLNINALVSTDNTLARRRFAALFSIQGVDQVYLDRIIDWVDPDDSQNAQGAEDYDYLGLERPYRTAGQLMMDVTELRLILEMDEEQFMMFAPYVTALPDPSTTINVNTVSSAVLQIIVPGLTPDAADVLVSSRAEEEPFETINGFTGQVPGSPQVVTSDLSVNSTFFKVSIRARYQERIGYLTSIIQRNPTDGTMRVIYRDLNRKVISYLDAQEALNDDSNDSSYGGGNEG
jgi:general secretion pathway protein K